MSNLKYLLILLLVTFTGFAHAQSQQAQLRNIWLQPQETARPWTFWYWMHGAVTREGISADLKAMKEAGIAGAYLMPIKSPMQPPHINSPVVQLSPEWWEMIRFTFNEAKTHGIKLGFHVSDGFALAGGPWITPEMSMQKLVWSTSVMKAGETIPVKLSQPESLEGFYKDIAVYAFPSLDGSSLSTQTIKPIITGSKPDSILQLLIDPSNNKNFSSEEPCWIQYEFEQSFTCRSILIRSRNNYQSNRLIVQASNDGKNFRTIKQLVPPRHGWQDWDANYTHSIPATTAKYFRFLYNREGSEPGSEDLDAAKWKQSLKVYGIELSSEARIDQYEGKNGAVWRISEASTHKLLPVKEAIRSKDIVTISQYLSKDGTLNWKAPPGDWTILRIGHTSTGHRNETAGGGKGLECDKFNPVAVTLQFNKWFGEIYNQVDADLVKTVLQYLHIDSWECGSQNWSADFSEEFKKRRGYDLLSFLPVMAGYPIDDVSFSENVLRDVRETIAELVNDKFYLTLADLAKTKGVQMSAESVAPTMVSDGMLHYKTADFPMGEFWLRSPTHDKPNDMLDAISGAHIYGKPIVQAESFTELRMAWDEHPGMLKTLLDQNFAKGLNRMFFHVYVHNPWIDKKPGMTLDAIGLFYQRDQPWWKHSKGFNEYIQRCQSLLQFGSPVTDIAVFTGEDVPRRSILPDRLISILPGIFKKEKLEMEKQRLKNVGLPLRILPAGVTHSANMADPEDWIDPLNGYAYDSYNKDALLRLTSVKDGRIQLATGAQYRLLVIPGAHKLSPNKGLLSQESAMKIRKLVKDGAHVIIGPDQEIIRKIVGAEKRTVYKAGYATIGKGKIIFGPYHSNSFDRYGIEKDFIAIENNRFADDIAWVHRRGKGTDLYFISNQKDTARMVKISIRVDGKLPEIWDPADGTVTDAKEFRMNKGRTELTLKLERNSSLFIVLQKSISRTASSAKGKNWLTFTPFQTLTEPWSVSFDTAYRGPAETIQWKALKDWSQSEDSSIRYYSGTAIYQNSFVINPSATHQRVWLNMNHVANSAEVFVNGKSCGISWAAPHRVEITKAIRNGKNELKIEVVDTWANRMIGDHRLPKEQRSTYTPHNFNFQGRQLLPAGLIGPVVIETGR